MLDYSIMYMECIYPGKRQRQLVCHIITAGTMTVTDGIPRPLFGVRPWRGGCIVVDRSIVLVT